MIVSKLGELPVAIFLLIQDGKMRDHAICPQYLSTNRIDQYAGFKVAIGCQIGSGEQEVVGVIADVAPLSGSTCWRISSIQDGQYRLINSGTPPALLVKTRLRVMYEQGWFDDLANLPLPVTITPDAIAPSDKGQTRVEAPNA